MFRWISNYNGRQINISDQRALIRSDDVAALNQPLEARLDDAAGFGWIEAKAV
jgi:hypothetical protein